MKVLHISHSPEMWKPQDQIHPLFDLKQKFESSPPISQDITFTTG